MCVMLKCVSLLLGVESRQRKPFVCVLLLYRTDGWSCASRVSLGLFPFSGLHPPPLTILLHNAATVTSALFYNIYIPPPLPLSFFHSKPKWTPYGWLVYDFCSGNILYQSNNKGMQISLAFFPPVPLCLIERRRAQHVLLAEPTNHSFFRPAHNSSSWHRLLPTDWADTRGFTQQPCPLWVGPAPLQQDWRLVPHPASVENAICVEVNKELRDIA